jgi:thimet oligopeptidase
MNRPLSVAAGVVLAAGCATVPRSPMETPPPDAARHLLGTPEAFAAACRADMERARGEAARLVQMAAPRARAAALLAFDGVFGSLAEASARASLARSVHPDAKVRDAGETCEQEVSALSVELSLDRALHDAVASLDLAGADPVTRWLVQKSLRDFRRAGVDRDEPTRKKVKELQDELTRIGQEFQRNIRDDVRTIELEPSELRGLPADFVRARPPGPGGKVTLTTNYPDYLPFMTYAESGRSREAFYRRYTSRGHPANGPVLASMLAKRQELARLLGYPSWAAYVTEDKMIGSEKAAGEFIEGVAAAARAQMERDHAALLARARRDDPKAERVEPWDSSYYQERVRADSYGFDAREARPYFEYRRVRDGVLDVSARLFGISYRKVETPVWHPDVDAYDVAEGGRLIGRIYLDMHPREGKYKHAAQFTLSNGVGGRRLPEGVLVCNFPRPGAEPALMEHRDVVTLFHEFGHLLHHVLGGRTRYAAHSGVSTEWDFVEAPSQMLEEWVWDPAVLATFARHLETGAPIPAEMVKRMKAADEYGKGLHVRRQMSLAALSLELHRRDAASVDAEQVSREMVERYTPFRFVEGTHFHLAFGHLEGYSAIYYTYMWSKVIAKDFLGEFRRAGMMDAATALRYRREILEPGGTRPAADLVKGFLGRAHSFDAFKAWLDGV